MKTSFIMAAYNEEKVIRKPLENLKKLHHMDPGIEVLIGLDGCTDRTQEIINEYSFIKVINFGGRKGKTKIINELAKNAKGDLIIIHDADWIFKVDNKERWSQLKDEFNDPKLGGIAESFPIEYQPEKLKKISSIGQLGSLWANYFWMEFQKKNYTYRENNKLYSLYSKENFPFMVNILRKKLFLGTHTMADDYQRALDILSKGYKLQVIEDINFPRMIAAFDSTEIKKMFKQKARHAFAKESTFKTYGIHVGIFNFYIPLFLFSLKNLYKVNNFKSVLGFFMWLFIFVYGNFKNKLSFKKKSFQEVWKIGLRR